MVRTATRGVVPAVVINARHIDGKWIEEETGEAFSVPGALWFETEQTNQDASPLKDVFNEDPTDWEEEREHIRQRCGDYC